MLRFLVKWAVNIIALLATVNIIAGISVDNYGSLVIAALAIGLLNAFLRPVIIIFTLPLTILTLGLFTLFINGAMLYLASRLVTGFHVADFWSAFWAALLFSVISFLLNILLNPMPQITARSWQFSQSKRPADDVIDITGGTVDDDDTGEGEDKPRIT
ncbi:MAG: phage holin family protein [Candidatus Omnitrophica bacterium]|nr:phage holin family protein [Candidatus Omnitrophota bacterium]